MFFSIHYWPFGWRVNVVVDATFFPFSFYLTPTCPLIFQLVCQPFFPLDQLPILIFFCSFTYLIFNHCHIIWVQLKESKKGESKQKTFSIAVYLFLLLFIYIKMRVKHTKLISPILYLNNLSQLIYVTPACVNCFFTKKKMFYQAKKQVFLD